MKRETLFFTGEFVEEFEEEMKNSIYEQDKIVIHSDLTFLERESGMDYKEIRVYGIVTFEKP